MSKHDELSWVVYIPSLKYAAKVLVASWLFVVLVTRTHAQPHIFEYCKDFIYRCYMDSTVHIIVCGHINATKCSTYWAHIHTYFCLCWLTHTKSHCSFVGNITQISLESNWIYCGLATTTKIVQNESKRIILTRVVLHCNCWNSKIRGYCTVQSHQVFPSFFAVVVAALAACYQTICRLKYNTMLCFAFLCENSKVLLCQTPYPFLILLAPPTTTTTIHFVSQFVLPYFFIWDFAHSIHTHMHTCMRNKRTSARTTFCNGITVTHIPWALLFVRREF